MPVDVYQPCPCGSGKKLKFCCQAIAAEMERVRRLQENNQTRMALQALEQLEAAHPGNPWVVTNRAAVLLSESENEAAKQLLAGFVETHPEHLFAQALLATAAFRADGFEPSKAIIHRAFQRCAPAFPTLIGTLAVGIGGRMHVSGRFMASRQHLALALRFIGEEMRQEVFLRLLEVDGDATIPYPLRSVHDLASYSGSEEQEAEFKKAVRLSDIGCWAPAARRFAKLAEQNPENAALWQNAGLCRAWDGDQSGAAEALHRAARLHGDYGTAVECETIAQLLDFKSSGDLVYLRSSRYNVGSLSQVITRLDEHERFSRIPLPPPDGSAGDEVPPAAGFQILEHPLPTEQPVETLTIDSFPKALGAVIFFDAREGQSAMAFLTATEGETTDAARAILEEVGGSELEFAVNDEEGPLGEGIPRELEFLSGMWHFPPKMPAKVRREFERQLWDRLVTQVWPRTPLAALGGKTPSEASGDPEQKLPLTASLYVLDAYLDQDQYLLDFPRMAELLKIELPPPIDVTESTSMSSFSAMQLLRVPIERLNDPQLVHALNRALLIQHKVLLYKVLNEALSRPSCREKIDLDLAFTTIVSICRSQNKRDEAFSWVEQAREWAKVQKNAFEATLQWELQELFLRAEDPSDPNLPPLLKRLWEYYGVKLPKLREQLAQLVEVYGIAVPWDETGRGPTTAGGIWTPESQQAESAAKKLWIPGQ